MPADIGPPRGEHTALHDAGLRVMPHPVFHDAHAEPLLSLAPRYLAGFGAFVVSLGGSGSGRSSPAAPGPLVIQSPHLAMSPGDRWLSPVPERPL